MLKDKIYNILKFIDGSWIISSANNPHRDLYHGISLSNYEWKQHFPSVRIDLDKDCNILLINKNKNATSSLIILYNYSITQKGKIVLGEEKPLPFEDVEIDLHKYLLDKAKRYGNANVLSKTQQRVNHLASIIEKEETELFEKQFRKLCLK